MLKLSPLKLLFLLLASAVCSGAGAQMIPTITVDSIEVQVQEAETIIVGVVTEAPKADPNRSAPRQATLKVQEVLKGKAGASLMVETWQAPQALEEWRVNSLRVLALVPKDPRRRRGTSHPGPLLLLDQDKLAVAKADFTVIREADELLRYVRELIKKDGTGSDPPTVVIRPPSSEAARQFEKNLGTYMHIDGLRVPATPEVLRRAELDLRSKDPNTRIKAIETLKVFKSARTIELLKPLLNDSHYSAGPFWPETGIEMREYRVRQAAYSALLALGVAVQKPLVQEKVSRHEDLEELHLGQYVDERFLTQLLQYKKLQRLTIIHPKVNDQHLAILSGLKSLQELSVPVSSVTDAGLKHLRKLPQLRKLNLDGNVITDAGLDDLGQMPSLKEVNLNRTEVTEKGLARLRAARPGLRILPVKAISRIHFYASAGDVEGIKRMLVADPKRLMQRDYHGNTPLHLAAAEGKAEAVRLLLEKGAELEAANTEGATPFHVAASSYRADIATMRLLISRGANINHRNKLGNTALHEVLVWGSYRQVPFLLAAGADVHAKNSEGKTPLNSESRAPVETQDLVRSWMKLTSDPTAFGPFARLTKASCNRQVYKLDARDKELRFWSTESAGRLVWPLKWDRTPTGRDFIGPFNQQAVKLKVENLPAHKNVKVEIELFLISSWDGNGDGAGPDILDIRVPGVGTLMHASFFNNTEEERAGLPLQSYPSTYGKGFHKGYTGAAEERTLGFNTRYGRSAVYKLQYTFAHTGGDLELVFTGLTVPQPEVRELYHDESWGIAGLMVKTD